MDEQQTQQAPEVAASQPEVSQPEVPQSAQSTGDDQSKIWGILGYIVGITFFIPLVIDSLKNNAYSKFHANQQLVLMIAGVALGIVLPIIAIVPIIGWIIALVGAPILWIAILVFAIMGIISASKGEMKPLPIIGGIKIIK